MIQKTKVRAYIRGRKFRIAADVYPALEDAVRTLLMDPKGSPTNPVDFSEDSEWRKIAYNEPSPAAVKRLHSWLASHPNDFVRLFHGTAKSHPILSQGLKPSSATRSHSLQSRRGHVSLSIYPGIAKDFGTLAYPGREIVVYAMVFTVRRLVPDLDQLRNQRVFGGRNVANSLAESLAYGHGAQVKGKVQPYQVSIYRAVSNEVKGHQPQEIASSCRNPTPIREHLCGAHRLERPRSRQHPSWPE